MYALMEDLPGGDPLLFPGVKPVKNSIAIMQPYFLPYLGYFQLINAVNTFVVYDNIKYTKKGWINRNRMLLNGRDALFTIPLASSSDYLPVNQKFLASDYSHFKDKTLERIKAAYRKAPYFGTIYPVMEMIFSYGNRNLFDFIFYSIRVILDLLEVKTRLVISSSLPVGEDNKGVDKVLAICNTLRASTYINPIGGVELYTGKEFRDCGINLYFHNMQVVPYDQDTNNFISHLSIMDVLMYNSLEQVKRMLQQYALVVPADGNERPEC